MARMTFVGTAVFGGALWKRVAIGAAMVITAASGDTLRADQAAERRVAHPRLTFEPNQGQFDQRVRFASRGPDYTLFLTDTEAVMVMTGREARRRAVVRLSIESAQAKHVVGLDPQPGIVNYLKGRDPSTWRTGIPTYGRVALSDVLSGVDLVYYGKEGTHEYDLIVAPGTDPSSVAIRVTGADGMSLDDDGHLRLPTPVGTLTMKAPHVYQNDGAARRDIEARYAVDDRGRIGFALGEYDTTAPLVIDPELLYSSFLGGTGNGLDQALAVTVDSTGAAYIVGSTETTDFPLQSALDPQLSGQGDAFITKLSATGTQMLYSTYIGGTGYDDASGLALRADGTAYIVGSTTSTDFPIVNGSQTQNAGSGDVYVAALNPAGTSIVRSTYLGGTGGETPRGVALGRPADALPAGVFGDVLIVHGSTTSGDFPLMQAGQTGLLGDRDGFVTVFDRTTLQRVYSSYAGLAGTDFSEGLQLNRRTGAMYLLLRRTDELGSQIARFALRAGGVAAGWSVGVMPLEVPGQTDVVQVADDRQSALDPRGTTTFTIGCQDYFDWNINPSRLYTRVCTLDEFQAPDQAAADVVDSISMAFTMPGCLPVAPATTCSERGVVMFHDDNGHLVAFTNFGGQRVGREFTPTRSVLTVDGRIHMIGSTSDATLPVVNPVQATNRGSSEGFVLTFDPLTRITSFFSYLGGGSFDQLVDLAVDWNGNRWVVGSTQSANFPVTANAQQPALRGRIDAFVTKISADPPVPPGPTNLVAQTSGLNLGLSWNAVAGATSYQIEAGNASLASNLAVVNVGNVTALQTVGPAGTYYVRVRAITAAGLSGPSNEVNFVLALPGSCTSAPPAPTGHAAQVGNLNITLSWNASAGATSYVLQAGNTNGASNLLNANIGATTTLSAIGPPGTFFTRVRAVNACGTSGPSNEISFTLGCSAPPAAPAPLTFSKAGTLLTLNWAVSPGAATYRLLVGTTSGSSNLVNTDIGVATGLQANVAGVPAATYFARIVASNACGVSAPSNEIAIPIP